MCDILGSWNMYLFWGGREKAKRVITKEGGTNTVGFLFQSIVSLFFWMNPGLPLGWMLEMMWFEFRARFWEGKQAPLMTRASDAIPSRSLEICPSTRRRQGVVKPWVQVGRNE